jgi:hypothetical protein
LITSPYPASEVGEAPAKKKVVKKIIVKKKKKEQEPI